MVVQGWGGGGGGGGAAGHVGRKWRLLRNWWSECELSLVEDEKGWDAAGIILEIF